ncbi:MAG: [Fe-Fe] hydrogenase large subunit C-terminal domain-containing protein, partial [Clostridia bacterium]
MTDYLKLKKSNCKNCHKCIRNCPVKSIRFADAQAHIISEECVLCGKCFVSCPQNAKEIRDDTEAVKADIASGVPVIVCLAPSFIANYKGTTIETMRAALLKLGFSDVVETAIGASIVKTRYEELIRDDGQSVIISSCCTAVNNLIQKYYPDALAYLANVVTPMEATCRLIKHKNPGVKTVFIGPCIAKKQEADNSHAVDQALTFFELSRWMQERGVTPETAESTLAESRARLFPLSGGILRSMEPWDKRYSYITVDGMNNCICAIKDIIDGNLSHCFVEMSACVGGCVGGPAMEQGRERPVSDSVAVNTYAGSKDFVVEQPSVADLMQGYPRTPVRKINVSEREILDVLKKMGKTKPEHELNCGTCGYNTCREKALAVCLGKAEISMCLPYLMEKAESFSDTIIQNSPNGILVLNEQYEIQQINPAACEIFRIKLPSDVLGMPAVTLLDPAPFMEALQRGSTVNNRQVYLAEYG